MKQSHGLLRSQRKKKRFELVSWEQAHSSNISQCSHALYKQRHHILEQGEDSLSVRSWREPLGFHLNSQPLNPKSLPTPNKQGVMGRNHSHGWPHIGHCAGLGNSMPERYTHCGKFTAGREINMGQISSLSYRIQKRICQAWLIISGGGRAPPHDNLQI